MPPKSQAELVQPLNEPAPPTARKVFVAVNEKGVRIGESHQNAKLTDHEVELIRQLHEDGLTYEVIAEKFECSKSTIAMICQYNRRAETVARWKTLLLPYTISLSEDKNDK